MTKILVDSELLEALAKCLDSAIDYSQRDFDHPPEPSTEWDFSAGVLVTELRAALDAPQQEAVAFTSSEQYLAIREAHQNSSADEYFKARPQIDCADRRKVFESAFNRGFDSCERVITHPAPSVTGCAECAEKIAPSVLEQEARKQLGELLAVIHGDGGHYAAEHGIAKATADAIAKWAALRTAPKAPTTDDRKDAEIAKLVRMKLTSGNGIPVERCTIRASEIAAIDTAIAAQKGEKE